MILRLITTLGFVTANIIHTELLKVSYILDRRDGNQPYLRSLREVAPNLFKLTDAQDPKLLDRVRGSLVGLATGDALGAHLEFRPFAFLQSLLEIKLEDGGTWELHAGQWTDDTTMALCLAASLITTGLNIPRDQMERYALWSVRGYMSSTGKCFDIGGTTGDSVREFMSWMNKRIGPYCKQNKKLKNVETNNLKNLNLKFRNVLAPEYYPFHLHFDEEVRKKRTFSKPERSGNGSLMRLAPIPIFYHNGGIAAMLESAETSSYMTHGGEEAAEACKLYALFIRAALNGTPKKEILSQEFYEAHKEALSLKKERIIEIANGSYRKTTEPMVRLAHMETLLKQWKLDSIYVPEIIQAPSNGYVVPALTQALWAFYNDLDSFRVGATLVVRLGNDTDTVAAIYGMLAGAYYGYSGIHPEWRDQVYRLEFLKDVADILSIRAQIPALSLDWAEETQFSEKVFLSELAKCKLMTPLPKLEKKQKKFDKPVSSISKPASTSWGILGRLFSWDVSKPASTSGDTGGKPGSESGDAIPRNVRMVQVHKRRPVSSSKDLC